jgi:hypothetical protein
VDVGETAVNVEKQRMDDAHKQLPAVYHRDESLVRVWIVRCHDWLPCHWNDVPPEAIAVTAASDACMTPRVAAQFVEGFNREMLQCRRSLWAIAVPISVRFEKDLEPGESAVERGLEFPPCERQGTASP